MLSFSGEGEVMLECEDPMLEELSFSDSWNTKGEKIRKLHITGAVLVGLIQRDPADLYTIIGDNNLGNIMLNQGQTPPPFLVIGNFRQE